MLDELSIINSMLATIGVDGLTGTDDDHPDWARAKQKLDETVFSVQKLGLWYNTTYPTWTPNTDGEILVPNGTLHCDPCNTALNYERRGRKLYDLGNRTFQFPAETSVQVKHVEELKLDEMPASAQDYVKHRARYDFALDEEVPENKLARYDNDKAQAWVELWREHMKNLDLNALDRPQSRRMARGRRWNTAERRILSPGRF